MVIGPVTMVRSRSGHDVESIGAGWAGSTRKQAHVHVLVVFVKCQREAIKAGGFGGEWGFGVPPVRPGRFLGQ